MTKKKKKAKAKAVDLPELAPCRAMVGVASASCMASPEDAAAMVAHGWQAVGTSGEKYILVGDEQAAASYLAREEGDDKEDD